MISLTLFSPTKKKQVSKHIVLVSIQYFISWILIATCLVSIILLATKLIMQNRFSQAVKQGTLVTQEYGTLNQETHLTNKKIDFLTNMQNNFIIWSPKLASLTALTSKDITLVTINIDHATKDIKISGHAKERDDLLFYKKQLESSGIFQKIDLPIENLLKAQNIYFKISGKLSV